MAACRTTRGSGFTFTTRGGSCFVCQVRVLPVRTLRVYLDQPVTDPERIKLDPDIALAELANMAAELARIEHFTGLQARPPVIG